MAEHRRHWWLIDHAHVIFWIVVMALSFGAYVVLHDRLHEQYLESETVNRSIQEAVRLYQIAEDPESGEIMLMVDGEPYDPLDDSVGPLGIGRSPTARGLLAETRSVVAEANQRIAGYVTSILSQFEPVAGRPNEFQAPLEVFDPALVDSPGKVVRIVAADPARFYEIEASSRGARNLFRLLASARVYDLGQRAADTGVDAIVRTIDDNAAVGDATRESLTRIEAAASEQVSAGAVQYVESATPTRQQILASYCGTLSAAREPLRVYFTGTPATPEDTAANAVLAECAVSLRLSAVGTQPAQQSFHDRLRNIVLNEIDFFWVFGPAKWAEILMLTWLGVLTEGLVRLANQYAGRDPDRAIWEPRESARTAMKLMYAPALSAIVIFALLLTDIFDADVAISGGGIAWFVPIAFVLGLFPNLSHAMLEKVAKWLFRTTTTAASRRRRERREQTAVGTSPVDPGSAPDFLDMKQRVQKAFIAPVSE